MRHFFIGVEHIFVTLLQIHGSIAASVMQECGLTPEYVVNAVRRKISKGGKERTFVDLRRTIRAETILDIAQEIALEAGRREVNERDVLLAILEEGQSVPVRVLAALGLNDTQKLIDMARSYTMNVDSQQPYIRVIYGAEFDVDEPLDRHQLLLLRRMFYGYDRIRIERRLTGGYSDATLVVVTPIDGDNRQHAAIAVKINRVDRIYDEAKRYEQHVKNKLPSMTARIEEKPYVLEASGIAGLKYTLVTGSDRVPRDLRMVLAKWSAYDIGDWLQKQLFPTFGHTWWRQNRPYRFQAWQEYDWLLPPVLTLEYMTEERSEKVAEVTQLKAPIKRTHLRHIACDDVVALSKFEVHRVLPESNTIQLAISQGDGATRAYQIEVRGVDFEGVTYYRREKIELIYGRVLQTRNEELLNALYALQPDFQAEFRTIRIAPDLEIPNPVIAYEKLLDDYVNGSLCTVHGDLHPGNIMIGPNRSAFLIDFAHSREGHTIGDWAMLEISLMSDYIAPLLPDSSWDGLREFVQRLIDLNGDDSLLDDSQPSLSALGVVAQIRQIVAQCLVVPDVWSEYYVALTFCSLRALSWQKTVSVTARRLLFLVAGVALHELNTRFKPLPPPKTPSPDDTEIP